MQLREYRKKTGLSQDEVAQKLGVHNTTYGNWELGKTEPGIETLIKLADFYHTTIDELVGRPTSLINKMILSDLERSIIEKVLTMDTKQQELTKFYVDTLMKSI